MQASSFRLIVRRGPQPNKIYELDKSTITIGRDITNDIVINDPEVSRHHCRLTQGGGGFTVEDNGSTNGTFVNGQRLQGAYPLQYNDMLGLGETVTLAYESAAQAATMVGGGAPGGEYGAPAGPGGYAQHPPAAPYSGGYGVPAQPSSSYPMPGRPGSQPPMAYENVYDYQDEPYEGGGAGRWAILGCGCFLVLCIVTSVIGGIIIDAQCWWDDIPVVSDVFNLGINEDATCR
ncbi:MAG: FHA domain-containing protein [Anaerolineae bacterium]|nr:FHA domain-containing protein [Anaerolineae bacterium]